MNDIPTYYVEAEEISLSFNGTVVHDQNGYAIFINGKLNKDNQEKTKLYLSTQIEKYQLRRRYQFG